MFDAVWALLSTMRHAMFGIWAEVDLTPPMAMALKELGEGSMPQGSLAHCLGYDPSSITGLADRLESRGLVERQVDPNDRRIKRLAISPTGRALLDDVHDRLRHRLPVALRLDDAEQQALVRLLHKAVGDDEPVVRAGLRG